jgi:hypothetical protein
MKKKLIIDKNYYGVVNELDPKYERDKKRIPKYLRQFKERGFDDTETWNLSSVILKFTLPRLKRFREVNNGYPGGLSAKKWDEMIDKMILGIELFLEDDAGDKVKNKQIDEGLELFFKWFRHLWW